MGHYVKAATTKKQFEVLFKTGFLISSILGFVLLTGLTWAGYVAPWSGRFYSLWDTGYAKIHIPIIASVSEHQPTTWASFFFDLHILIAVFPAGLWFTMKKLDDSRVFIILWAIFGSYFAGVMVRLMLTLTPCVCMVSAIAFTELLTPFFKDALKTQKSDEDNENAARVNSSNELSKRSKASAAYIAEDNKKDAFGPTGPMFSVR